MEHRCGGRKAVNFQVRIISRPGLLGSGVIRNLSQSGAYIQTDLRLAAPTWVRIEPLYAAGPESDTAGGEACVVRITRDGVGVEWNDAAPTWATALMCGERPTAELAGAERPRIAASNPRPVFDSSDQLARRGAINFRVNTRSPQATDI